MKQGLAHCATLAAIGLAIVGILMVADFAKETTEVAVCIAGAGIYMFFGSTLKSADRAAIRAGIIKAVGNFTYLTALVTIRVTGVLILVPDFYSGYTALVTVYIKARGVFMGNNRPLIPARVTYRVAVVIVAMLCFAGLFAQVASGVTIVIK